MPKKYQLKPKPAPSRFILPGPFGIIEGDGCLNCGKCVKKSCPYSVYQKREYDPRQMMDTADSLCKNCFRCVQGCYARILSKSANPEFWSMGDDYWTPEIIASNQRQAETGKIPVSGAGYGGPFSGPGFDSMWTDMSEIVRPTRDGIHGREYISTSVELGRIPPRVPLASSGTSSDPRQTHSFARLEVSVPFIFDLLPLPELGSAVRSALAQAAVEANTLMILHVQFLDEDLASWTSHLVPFLPAGLVEKFQSVVARSPMVQIPFTAAMGKMTEDIKRIKPGVVVSVRLSLTPQTEEEVEASARAGVDAIHLVADDKGREQETDSPLFIKDRIRAIHLHRLKGGGRNQFTLIFGGGIALAEHVAKAIICGADAVSIERPLLTALECRLCPECFPGTCPVEIEKIDPAWGRQRVINLVAAWHGQLLEVLGAMGMRDVRRLRGEVGRAIFLEEIERETFGQIFGEAREKKSLSAPQAELREEGGYVLASGS